MAYHSHQNMSKCHGTVKLQVGVAYRMRIKKVKGH